MNARNEMPLGLVYGLENEAYHSGPGLSNSGLSLLAKSPAHYYGKKLDPRRPAEVTKGGQLEGSLMHCALLEPAEFDKRYPVGPSVNRNTKAWKEFSEAHPGLECIQQDQKDAAYLQAESLRSKVRENPDMAELLSLGDPEVSGYWIDEATGVLCRFRADWVHPVIENGRRRGVILFDGKTYSDASEREFSKQVGRKGYYRQAAFYSDGYQRCTGERVLAFVFGAVETEWPHVSQTYVLNDEAMSLGREECLALVQTYADCQKSGVWPGYARGMQLLALPSYMTNSPEEMEITYA